MEVVENFGLASDGNGELFCGPLKQRKSWQVMENTCGISRARSGARACSWQGKDLVLKAQALGFIASSSTIQEMLTLGCLWVSLSKDGMFFYIAPYESHEKK